jgi:maltooligosyltrehalose trehalohydrolase
MHHGYEMDHGATVLPGGRSRFRLWAPSEASVAIALDGGPAQPMQREAGDWFSIELQAPAGTEYCYVLPDGMHVPDPTSRLQRGDVHGVSVVVDPRDFDWRHGWNGRPWNETVLYEIHPGAMGGFAGVTRALADLAETGITAIELMPVGEFPGQHNWGYDGVLPYAPDSAYGTPDELKMLIDTAHAYGIMVFLDVVYNHFGPDGAYIHVYAKSFFSEDFHTPWGAGIDFRRTVVQEYFIDNALYWLREYRFDGLRFDALGAIEPQSFLSTLAQRIRDGIEPGRQVHLVMEHEHNAARLLRGAFDAQWTDDIHHALHVLLTGETGGYYQDFADPTPLLARSLADGFSFQGEISPHANKPRGEYSGDLPTSRFVAFLQNHDQIGNRAIGDRLSATVDPRALRAAHAFILLAPFIPLLFMGEEWASRTPFQFFTDHADPTLAEQVRTGRVREFSAFLGDEAAEVVPDPNHHDSFAASCIDRSEADRATHRGEFALTRYLLALRRAHIAPYICNAHSAGASVLAPGAVLGAWTLDDGRLLRIALNLAASQAPIAPTDSAQLYASSPEAAASVHQGAVPGFSLVVWLSSLAADEAAPAIEFADGTRLA